MITIKKSILKKEALLSTLLLVLTFIFSPVLGVAVLIFKLLHLNKVLNTSKLEEMLKPSIISESTWLLVAIAAGAFLPLWGAVLVFVWRTYMLYKAIMNKRAGA